MPIDKQTKSATNKPITPALSTHFRNAKAPIVPRLAGSAPTSPAVSARKDIRAQTLSPIDNVKTTPLVGHVTPRSGVRNSRLGSTSPRTPSSGRQPTVNHTSHQANTSSSSRTANEGQNNPSASSPTSFAVRKTSGSSSISRRDDKNNRFFRATEARPQIVSPSSPVRTETRPASRSPITPAQVGVRPKSVGFLRAGSTLSQTKATPPSTDRDGNAQRDGRFFRINDVPSNSTSKAVRPPLTKQLSSASAPAMRTRSPDITKTVAKLSPQMSPKKDGPLGIYRPASPQKAFVVSPAAIALPNSPTDRRNSLGSNSVASRQSCASGHKKAASVSTIGHVTAVLSPLLAKLQAVEPGRNPFVSVRSQQQALHNLVASSGEASLRSASLTSTKTTTASTNSDTDGSDISKLMLSAKDNHVDGSDASTQARSQPTQQSQTQINAANARRERKVLDLEISNSSLLAINKTLERELKKQSTELRRFRRLSRTGRLSFAPSNRSVSGQSMLSSLSELTEPEEDEDDLSLSEEDEDDESELSNEGESLISTESTSSSAARARRRARDEKRLMLDLSKHQQMLIDSQKLSQSIRKCLNYSEELIKEGKKALEYKVGIGDVKLGGRVLSAEDYDNEQEGAESFDLYQEGKAGMEIGPRRGLLSPSLTTTELLEANGWVKPLQISRDHTSELKAEIPLGDQSGRQLLLPTSNGSAG